MSNYTVELRTIVEAEYGQEEHLGYKQIESFLDSHANDFMPTYPIWDENYRLVLNKLILKYYWTREIGMETPGRFMLALDAELNKIMPYYNRLMLADDLLKKYMEQYGLRDGIEEREGTRHSNDVGNANITSNDVRTSESDKHSDTTSNRTSDNSRENIRDNSTHTDNHTNNVGTNSDNSETSRVEHQLYSDTPQGGLEGVEGTAGQTATVDGLYYLTNVTKNYGTENSKGKSQNEQSSNGTTDYSENDKTNESSKSKEQQNGMVVENSQNKDENLGKRKEQRESASVEEYLETVSKYGDFPAKRLIELGNELYDINSAIIKRLEPLFMQIWADESNLGNGWFGMLPEHYYY